MVQSQVLRKTRDSIARIEEKTRQSIARIEERLLLKRKAVLRAVAGLCLPLFALIIAFVDPVPKFGRWYMRMAEGYNGYTMFEKPPIGSYARVFLFNVTNSEQFLSGKDRDLKLQEIGPFTYLEYRWNSNISVDWTRGVVRFVPQMNITFLPELSIGDPKDYTLVVPNIPLLSISSVLADYSMWTNIAFNLLAGNLKTKSFKTLTVEDYLWGFPDDLMSMAHTVLPWWIDKPNIGILQQLYDGYGKQTVEMELQQENRYRIRSWNGDTTITHWTDTNNTRAECNHLHGSYEGMFFTPGFTEDTKFHLYRRPLCRTIPMRYYSSNVTSYGVKVLEFGIAEDAFEPKKENDCICKSTRCLPRGLSDMSPCHKGVPFTLSKPHFMDADPAVFHKLQGLKPDPEKHKTMISIDPEMGLPLKTISASQTNLNIGDIRYVNAAKPFSNIIYPLVWLKLEFQDIPEDIQLVLRWRFTFGPAVLLTLELVLLISGLLVAGYHVFRYIRPWTRPEMDYRTIPLEEKEMQFVHDNPLMDDIYL